MDEYCLDSHLAICVQPCPELDLSRLSVITGAGGAPSHELDAYHQVETTISSSGKDLIEFEALENAARTHESFVSTASYAARLWRSHSADSVHLPDSDFQEVYENYQNPQHPLDLNPEFDHCDSDVDTVSIASVREFHDSLPIITSTPPKDMRKETVLSRKSKKTNSPDCGKVVRHLFPSKSSAPSLAGGLTGQNTVDNRVENDQSLPASARCVQLNDGEIMEQLQDKVVELKAEIARYKTENAKLIKRRLENDALFRQLEKDRSEFDVEREKIVHDLEEMKLNELRKLEMEKKILYKHMTAQTEEDTRRLRESNEELIREVENYKDELRKSDIRHESVAKRLRDRIKSMEVQLDAVRDQADALEEDKQQLVREVVRFPVQNETVSDELIHDSGTIEQTFRDGKKVRFYKNGTKEEISHDGRCTTTTYCNGDIKQIFPDKEVYFYKANQSIHTKFPDGREVYQFPNNQTEKLLPDGSKEIQYPNSVIKKIYPDSNEEIRYSDGTVEFWNEKAKTRTICFSKGEIEVHTPQWKQRKFPDGSEKVVFTDGRSESRYSDGRIRIKDPQGKLLFDSGGNKVFNATGGITI
ncbi:LOW QUALITY PROTEIN: centromere protein J-like [Paramacrobiotus metropolitanus]|uniref:LOW QUALITY PROTEIN: centromere protein J-like n=1 Tax=Paramacrobiotus metropolitanus TaxID=2943436 RepID=UPI00244624BA|nr:LOW QUALITY PROTEIN: centromere protein J-like [Paramacrobiotus metropolitanus]